MKCLASLDIKRSIKIFHNIIGCGHISNERNKFCNWGKECARIGTQTCSTFYLSSHAEECLFSPNHSRLNQNDEIISNRKKICLMRIHS